MDCSSNLTEDVAGYMRYSRCDQCYFIENWTSMMESITKVASDEIILNYNQAKADVIQNLLQMDEMLKKKEGSKWSRAINVSPLILIKYK